MSWNEDEFAARLRAVGEERYHHLHPFNLRMHAGTLSQDEIRTYIEHRCTVAGATTVPFDTTAHEAVHEISRGNLRAIDSLSLKALEISHAQDQDVIDTSIVVAARAQVMP